MGRRASSPEPPRPEPPPLVRALRSPGFRVVLRGPHDQPVGRHLQPISAKNAAEEGILCGDLCRVAGYAGLTREACALGLRQFATWCAQHHLRLFQVRRARIECFVGPGHHGPVGARRLRRAVPARSGHAETRSPLPWPCRVDCVPCCGQGAPQARPATAGVAASFGCPVSPATWGQAVSSAADHHAFTLRSFLCRWRVVGAR